MRQTLLMIYWCSFLIFKLMNGKQSWSHNSQNVTTQKKVSKSRNSHRACNAVVCSGCSSFETMICYLAKKEVPLLSARVQATEMESISVFDISTHSCTHSSNRQKLQPLTKFTSVRCRQPCSTPSSANVK